MPSESNRDDPPYLRVAQDLRTKIMSGELADGAKVPSTREIVRDYGVAMATATKALNVLKSEGLTHATPGGGTVVSTSGMHRSGYDRAVLMRRNNTIYPPGYYAGDFAVEIAAGPERITDALSLPKGSTVICRRRTTFAPDGRPLSTSVSWFDGTVADRVPRILAMERIKEGTPTYVAAQTGRELSPFEAVRLRASTATDEEATRLHIEPGSAVQRSRNWYYDTDGGVLEFGESAKIPELETEFTYRVDKQPEVEPTEQGTNA